MPRTAFWAVSIFAGLLGTMSFAQSWSEPTRGSETRSELMDAIRPHVEWELGAPVLFVVKDLRVYQDVAFGMLNPERPGGILIDSYNTPGAYRGSFDPNLSDGVGVSVLYRKVRNTWVAVHHAIGATDVWFAHPEYCREYYSVIPEFCG